MSAATSNQDERKVQRIKSIAGEVSEFHPLLQRLLPKLPGVNSIEYTHGSQEHGADLIILKNDLTIDLPSYCGVIAKCGNINKSESHRVVEQARECHGSRYFLGGKQEIILSEIWVMTTGTIGEPAKKLIHDEFAASKIHFIQRDHLIKLIDNYLPSYWTDVDVHVGDYLHSVSKQVISEDRELSLIPHLEEAFYIEQDIVRFRTRDPLPQRRRKLPKPESVKLLDEIKSNRFILVEGDAGSGKSKCAREVVKMCCDVKNYHDKHIVPVRISWTDLIENFDSNISKAIESTLSNYSQLFNDKNNEFLLISDGLDELKQKPEEISAYVSKLLNQIGQDSNLRLLVFSRSFFAEFGDSLNISGISRLELMPLTLSKTIKFLKKLCSDLAPNSRIFEDLKKSSIFNQLPKSPIAAILLARILREKQTDLPSTLPELYSKYVELSLGRWDIERGIQSEKEYEALDAVLMDLAEYVIQNQLDTISYSEALEFFKRYLEKRNLGLAPENLADMAAARCPILRVSKSQNRFAFKHRTFAEFLFAKKAIKHPDSKFNTLKLSRHAFNLYWATCLYFYVGLRRDCPQLLEEILILKPDSEEGEWIKTFSISDLLLAAYSTPYYVVPSGLKVAALMASKIHRRIIDGKGFREMENWPTIQILALMQFIFKTRYSYQFFLAGIPDAVQEIMLSDESREDKAYAIFFLCVTYKELGGKDNFDFLLKEDLKPLPLAVDVFVTHMAQDMLGKSKLLKRHEKRVMDSVRSDRKLKNQIDALFDKPLSWLHRQKEKKSLKSTQSDS